MGRRRAAGTPAGKPTGVVRLKGDGAARVAWSYLAALLVVVVTGLGFALADPIQAGACGPDDIVCTLGVVLVAASIAALVGIAAAAALFRLGWEWGLVAAAVVVAMPGLLDLIGGPAWILLALTPALAALATWGRQDRPRWRPVVIGMAATLVIAGSLIWTFW